MREKCRLVVEAGLPIFLHRFRARCWEFVDLIKDRFTGGSDEKLKEFVDCIVTEFYCKSMDLNVVEKDIELLITSMLNKNGQDGV